MENCILEIFIVISAKEVLKMETGCAVALKPWHGLGFSWWVVGEEEGDVGVTLV